MKRGAPPAGARNERVTVEKPAATPERDAYGHQTDNAANWTEHAVLWAQAVVKPADTKHTLSFLWTTKASQITSGDRITRASGLKLHVLHAADPDASRQQIVVTAEPE